MDSTGNSKNSLIIIFCILSVSLVVTVFFSSVSAEEDNLIRNGDFSVYSYSESMGVMWPDTWNLNRGEVDVYEVGADTNEYHTDKASAYIKVLKYDPNNEHCCHVVMPIKSPADFAGDTLRCEGWLKTVNMLDYGCNAQIVLVVAKRSREKGEPPWQQLAWEMFVCGDTSSQWKYGTEDIVIPQDANDLALHLYLKAGRPVDAVAWYDDIRVTNLSTETSVFHLDNPQIQRVPISEQPLVVHTLDGRAVTTCSGTAGTRSLLSPFASGVYLIDAGSEKTRHTVPVLRPSDQ